MKLAIFFVLAAVAFAQDDVEVIQDIRDGPIQAVYNNILELSNGVKIEEAGAEGSAGQSNSQGRFAFISPEGIPVEVSFTADENGFQPISDLLPQDHPLPPHAVEQLRIAEQQRAEGIEFDERGFRI